MDYTSRGSLAALGCRTGVAKVFGVRLAGFPAWFLWRTVYLMKMPGVARRLRVALDWALWFRLLEPPASSLLVLPALGLVTRIVGQGPRRSPGLGRLSNFLLSPPPWYPTFLGGGRGKEPDHRHEYQRDRIVWSWRLCQWPHQGLFPLRFRG